LRWAVFCAATDRPMRRTLDWAPFYEIRERGLPYREQLRAYAEVESALAAEHYLAEQELHLAQAAKQLVAARRLAIERYRSGVGIYLVVLESQSRALIAESELLAIRRQRLDNRVELHLALGGGFESHGADDHVEKGSDS